MAKILLLSALHNPNDPLSRNCIKAFTARGDITPKHISLSENGNPTYKEVDENGNPKYKEGGKAVVEAFSKQIIQKYQEEKPDKVIIAMDFNLGHTGENFNVARSVLEELEKANIKEARFILTGSGGTTPEENKTGYPTEDLKKSVDSLGDKSMAFSDLRPSPNKKEKTATPSKMFASTEAVNTKAPDTGSELNLQEHDSQIRKK